MITASSVTANTVAVEGDHTYTLQVPIASSTDEYVENTGACFSLSTDNGACFSVSSGEDACFYIVSEDDGFDKGNLPEDPIDFSDIGFTELLAIHAVGQSSLFVVGMWKETDVSTPALIAANVVYHPMMPAEGVSGIGSITPSFLWTTALTTAAVGVDLTGETILSLDAYDNIITSDMSLRWGSTTEGGIIIIEPTTGTIKNYFEVGISLVQTPLNYVWITPEGFSEGKSATTSCATATKYIKVRDARDDSDVSNSDIYAEVYISDQTPDYNDVEWISEDRSLIYGRGRWHTNCYTDTRGDPCYNVQYYTSEEKLLGWSMVDPQVFNDGKWVGVANGDTVYVAELSTLSDISVPIEYSSTVDNSVMLGVFLNIVETTKVHQTIIGKEEEGG